MGSQFKRSRFSAEKKTGAFPTVSAGLSSPGVLPQRHEAYSFTKPNFLAVGGKRTAMSAQIYDTAGCLASSGCHPPLTFCDLARR